MISIPILPMGKPRMTQRDKWKRRPVVENYWHYCDSLKKALPGYTLPGELTITFFIPMPPSWSKKRRLASLGAPHTQKPDIDNLCKAFMDAFKKDDSHVHSLIASKYWAEAGSIEVAA